MCMASLMPAVMRRCRRGLRPIVVVEPVVRDRPSEGALLWARQREQPLVDELRGEIIGLLAEPLMRIEVHPYSALPADPP